MLFIKNGKVLTMAGKNFEKGYVIVDKGKIKDVGEKISVKPEKNDEVIDASGCWVMPGLIEAHCHVGISEEKKGFEGNDCNEAMEPVTPHLRAIDAINPMDCAFKNAIGAGITSAMVGPGSSNVVGGQFSFIKLAGSSIDEMLVKSPAAMKVAFGENPKTNYNGMNMMPSTRMSIAAMLREELFNAKKYMDERERGETEEDFKKECWLPVLRGEIPLKAHVHRADDILTAIRIAKEFGIRMTLDHCTEGHFIAEQIKASGFPAIVGPSIASRNKIEIQYMDFKTVGILKDAGVLTGVTTDHPVSLLRYLPICAGLAAREGLGVEEGLKAITVNAAKICGVEDRVGTLEEGKDADIAIFDGNPMEVFTRTKYTLIDGEIFFKNEEKN